MHLAAGSSDLIQTTLKIMRPSNLMRCQVERGEKETESQLSRLHKEMLSRRQAIEETIKLHKASLIEEK